MNKYSYSFVVKNYHSMAELLQGKCNIDVLYRDLLELEQTRSPGSLYIKLTDVDDKEYEFCGDDAVNEIRMLNNNICVINYTDSHPITYLQDIGLDTAHRSLKLFENTYVQPCIKYLILSASTGEELFIGNINDCISWCEYYMQKGNNIHDKKYPLKNTKTSPLQQEHSVLVNIIDELQLIKELSQVSGNEKQIHQIATTLHYLMSKM